MKRLLMIAVMLVAMTPSIAFAADMTTSVAAQPSAFWWTGNPQKDTGWKWSKEVEARLEASTSYGWSGLFFTPTDTTPTASKGMIYYDLSENALKAHDGSSFVALTTGTGDNTLDQAYDQGGSGAGRAIDADSGAVTITVSNTDNNVGFIVTQNDTTNDNTAMQIVSTADLADAIALDIDAQATGRDIEGTGATWYVSGTGNATFSTITATTITQSGAGAFAIGGPIQMESGAKLNNSTDTEIGLIDTGAEDFIFDLDAGTNAVGLKSSTGVDELAMGLVDDLTGVGTIVFDAAAASITLTADAGTEDLTIQQDGVVDASLVLFSAGTGADALTISTDAGGMDIIVAGAADAEDLDILSNRSLTITSTEATADAIKLNASNAAGGFDLDFGTSNMTVTGTGVAADFTLDCDKISIDGTGTSNISFTNGGSEDVTIAMLGAADHSLIIAASGTGADAMQIATSAGGMDITVAGSSADDDLDLSSDSSINLASSEAIADAVTIAASAGGIDITTAAGMDIDITATGGKVIVTANENAAGAINLTTAGGGGTSETILVTNDQGNADASIDINSTAGGLNIDVAKSLNLASSEAMADAVEIIASAGGVDITTAATFDIDLTATGGAVLVIASEAAAVQFKVDAQGTYAGFAIDLETTNGGIRLNADDSANGDITIDAADVIALTTGDSVVIDGGPIVPDIEYIVADATDLLTYGTSDLDSSGAPLTFALGSPTLGTAAVGTYKVIAMSTAGNNADISITNHETSDPEVARFDAADEYILLLWTGTEWATIASSCSFP